METQAAVPSPTDACPPLLRTAVERWKRNELSDEEFIETSYAAALDCVADYAPRVRPTPPEAVVLHRQMTWEDRKKLSDKDKEKFFLEHQRFFDMDHEIIATNASNVRWLRTLLAWAEEKVMPGSVTSRLRMAIQAHQLPAESDQDPVLV